MKIEIEEKWEVKNARSSDSTLKTMSTEKTGDQVLVEGKLDWRGKPVRKGEHGGVGSSLLILAAFMFESVATLALAANLITYFTEVMHLDIAVASNALTNYMGTSYIVSVAIAVFADIFIGRYKSVIISASIELVGLLLLTLQAHFPSLKPPLCNLFDPTGHCLKVDGANAVLLFISLYLVAIGSAGIKASLPVHCADQFDEKDPQEARQMSSFFNWLLLSICLGGAISLTLVVWVQNEKGWDRGFGISTVALLSALVVFLAGVPKYRIAIIQGTNALLEIIQVYVAAFRNRNLDLPEDPSELYEIDGTKESLEEVEFLPHRDKFRFLDKAAIRTSTTIRSSSPSPWKLCRVTQVENAKTILGMIPIFCSAIIMSTCLAQLQTFSIQQGSTMDTRVTSKFHIPPASLPIIPLTFMIIMIPVYDRLFVPFARRITGHTTGITHFQRIGVGLVLSCISMATAAVVEVKRKNAAKSHGMLDALPVLQPLPISVFWLSFQYFIFGIADMFTSVGLLEFFYSEAPMALKSISTSFLWCSMSLGYFLSTILVELVNAATKNRTKSRGWLAGNNLNRNHVNLFYWLLCILSFINFLNYLFWAKWYKYRPQVPRDTAENGKVEAL
ncbi:protein NRT1/ PTR FAMILY 4.5-like [Phoenix dactylifera]|uniref:Protein NRT1/ PTR FAMILY 4.5-like n=1 Tax=Phoenix dactylifera TaxID=42345 RepID=A0A8B7C628_PHODC|nr:protein NRT1/ PTR FAMILY 4.5-like [Phoenix dactylifera]